MIQKGKINGYPRNSSKPNNMVKLISICSLLIFALCSKKPIASHINSYSNIDSVAAIEIATREWNIKFGKKIKKHKPFVAHLENDSIWIVEGTLHSRTGGVPYAHIRKSDGVVLIIYRQK